MNDQTPNIERHRRTGLPFVDTVRIQMPKDTLWQESVEKAVAAANDYLVDTYSDETHPPLIILDDSGELIVPKFGVIVDTLIRSMVRHKPVKAAVALLILKALEGQTDCPVWAVANEAAMGAAGSEPA